MNAKTGILKNYLRIEISTRISLKIGILENCLKIKVKKIKIKNYLKEIGTLKIKFKNWDSGNKIWKELELWKLSESLEF